MIAHSLPHLWSSIALWLQPQNLYTDIKLVTMWLARSAEVPLSICLRDAKDFRNLDVRPLMDVFVSCCHRWKKIRLHLGSSMMQCLSAVRGHLLSLEWLSTRTPYRLPVLNLFEFAPQLRHLHINGINPVSLIRVPWSQLQTCKVGGLRSAQHCLDILSMMPNVESTFIDIDIDLDDQLTSHNYGPGSLELTKLRSMECLARSEGLVAALHLPMLEELKYTYLCHNRTHVLNLISLLSRCSLKSLTFNTGLYHYPHALDMISILEETPELTELAFLNIRFLCLSPEFLRRFTHTKRSTGESGTSAAEL